MSEFFKLFLFGVLVQITFGRGLQYTNDLERRLVTLEARQFADNDALEERIQRLEIHLPIQRRISESNPVDSSPSLEQEHVDNEKIIGDKFDKLEDGLKKELAEQLGKLTLKFDEIIGKLAPIEKESSSSKRSEKFQKIGEKYYYIENDVQKDWFDAKDVCSEMEGHLVTLQNEKEWKALAEHLSSDKNYWVDINDKDDENEFISDFTEKKASFLKWREGEPNNGGDDDDINFEDCVELRGDSKFYMNDALCSNRANFICEKSDL
ncbi:low affinity immunoglobulin epsilon Fc receptor-like [Drosophila takahashii]|uniref:low affinity immunoglobulin epsilon Fc receptor-like n=1 Tax=Drosophila takahashii TaxID=29030 RepID=UPI001CF8520F|nr:low affinity immunoglobulin epsilon Fc receptor-like [Drosophila takahashii]